jgi:hypothetical protein
MSRRHKGKSGHYVMLRWQSLPPAARALYIEMVRFEPTAALVWWQQRHRSRPPYWRRSGNGCVALTPYSAALSCTCGWTDASISMPGNIAEMAETQP